MLKKSLEGFNPMNPEFKKVEDLPKEEQENFRDVNGGFVKKETLEYQKELEEKAKTESLQRPFLDKLLRKKEIRFMEIAHERGFLIDEYETELISQKKDAFEREKEKIERLSDSLAIFKRDLENSMKERNELLEEIAMFKETEGRKKIEQFAERHQPEIENIKKIDKEIEGLNEEVILSVLEEAEEKREKLEIVQGFDTFDTEHDKDFKECQKQIGSLESSIETFEERGMPVPLEVSNLLEKSKEEKDMLFKKMRKINENKIAILPIYLANSKYRSENIEVKKEFEKEFEDNVEWLEHKGVSKILVEHISCGDPECDGRCERSMFSLGFVFDVRNKKRGWVDIDTLSCERYKKEKTEAEKHFLEKKKKNLDKDLIEIIAEKTGKKNDEVIKDLKGFLYKQDLKVEKPSEKERRTCEQIKTFNNISQDPEEFSLLLLERFLSKKIDYKVFLNKIKNVDSKLSNELFGKLRELDSQN